MIEFIQAMRAAGVAPAKELNLSDDGKLTRFRVEGDKPGSLNGWAVLHRLPVPVGNFGSWRTREAHTWHAQQDQAPTPAERAAMQRQLKAMQQARAEEQARVHEAARQKAATLWDKARPATTDHPYLARKGVPPYGLRRLGQMLLVPARDVQGELHTLEFISPDGSKRFLTGGRRAGCYAAIGRPDARLLVCEGWATGATLHQATGRCGGGGLLRQQLAVCGLGLAPEVPPHGHRVVCG